MRGKYSSQVQEAVTRLGSRLPFAEAREELERMWGVKLSTTSVREITLRNGRLTDEVIEAELSRLKQAAPETEARPKQVVFSVDGGMVQLRNGEWREVKTVAIGEFESQWDAKKQEVVTQTSNISYFSSAERVERFTEKALVEWHERGVEQAEQVVTVNDGAMWIQSFIEYHCPQATRVIDFAHAQAYVAAVGKAIYGAESEIFKSWYAKMSKQLGTQPPKRTINDLRLLWRQHQDHPLVEEIDQAIAYLERRESMIDYPHFRQQEIPIGSGIVESAHKVVMQRRMKQAGMRWSLESVNPILALRMAICNRRWPDTWCKIETRFRATKHASSQPQPPEPQPQLVSDADVHRLEQLADRVQTVPQKKEGWQNHRWIFPHRQPLSHKN